MENRDLVHNFEVWALFQLAFRGVMVIFGHVITAIIIYFATKWGEKAVLSYLKAHGHVPKGIE